MAINPLTGLPLTPEEEAASYGGPIPTGDTAGMLAMNIPRTPTAPAGIPAPAAPPPVPEPPLLTPSAPAPLAPVPVDTPVLAPEKALPAQVPLETPAVPPPALAMPKLPGGGGGGGPSEKAQRAELAGIQADQASVAQQKGDLGIQRAGVEEKVAQQQADLANQAEARRAELEQATSAEIAKRQSALDQESQAYKSMGFKDFWSRATIGGKEGTVTGARILGAISMALGAAGASLAHTPNFAQEMIDKAIDRDYQMQRDTILKQKDVVNEARMGLEGARQAKADKLLALENWRKSAYDQAATQAKVMLSKMGVPEAEADKNALVANNRQKAFDSGQALTKGLAEVSNLRAETDLKRAEAAKARAEAAAKGTEGADDKGRAAGKQIELATMGSQMMDDLRVIDKSPPLSPATLAKIQTNESALKTVEGSHGVKALVGTLAGRAAGIVPKSRLEGVTPDQQKVVNSWDLLAKKAATVLSGQGHANVESTMAMMMPKPEDSPQIISQKLENLRHIAENAQVLSGKYGQRLEAADQARGGAPAAPSSNRQQVVQASQWLQANPNDPRAAAVRRKIAELTAGGL
jgi:hypothetical protein